MPHAPWCKRDEAPSLWLRIRYGVFAKQALMTMRPCASCDHGRDREQLADRVRVAVNRASLGGEGGADRLLSSFLQAYRSDAKVELYAGDVVAALYAAKLRAQLAEHGIAIP